MENKTQFQNQGEIQLENLKNDWKRHVFYNLFSQWIDKDKQKYSQTECKKINDTLTEGYQILESLNVNYTIQLAEFLKKMNDVCYLMNK